MSDRPRPEFKPPYSADAFSIPEFYMARPKKKAQGGGGMIDNTPTTKEVRLEYVEYCEEADCHKHQEAGRMFDAWLAEHDHQERAAERERIIAILERRALDLEACGKQDDCKEMAMIVRVCMSDIREVSK